MRVGAVVPAHNEADRVGESVRALLGTGRIDRVLVVDDGSEDGTAEVARAAGACVHRLARNRGKGYALSEGIARSEGEIVLLADADLGSCAAKLSALIDAVEEGADLAIASFRTSGGFGIAKRLARSSIRWLGGKTMESPLSGQRAIARRALEALIPFPRGWGVEVAMTVRALWNGLTVVEVPLALEHRATGRSLAGFRHRGRQCLSVLGTSLSLFLEGIVEARSTACPPALGPR